MRRILTIIALLLVSQRLVAQVQELERTVKTVQNESGMQHAQLSVCVYNTSNNRPVYNYNSQVSLTPASVQKVLTTGVGFARLGSDFRFATRLATTGHIDHQGVLHGNVYIIGGGDPLLGSYRYRQTAPDSLFDGWYRALKRKGISSIEGRICYLTSIFDDQPLHDTWQWGDVGNYYGAGVSGLNFHENMYFVYFTPGHKLGYPASVARLQPRNIGVQSRCEVTTGPENSGDRVVIYGDPNSSERLYRGTVPLGKKDFAVRGAMPNPAQRCADLFAAHLRSRGIQVAQSTMQVYSQPDSLHVLLDYYSSDYYTIAQYTNLTSNNVYAESIFKYLGYMRYGKGSFHNGSKAIMEWLREKRLELSGIRVEDGSGLSRRNQVTADFLCRYLSTMTHESFFYDFQRSLAVTGESGTAKSLLHALPPGMRVHIKTGSMEGVRSYAGYITAANGEKLAFAIICNGHECTPAAINDKLNRILHTVASLF